MTTFFRSRPFAVIVGAAVLMSATLPVSGQDSAPWRAPSDQGYGQQGYGGGSDYSNAPRDTYAPRDNGYSSPGRGGGYDANGGYDSGGYGGRGDAYSPGGGGANDAYSPPGNDSYAPGRDGYAAGGDSYGRGRSGDSYSDPGRPSYDGAGGYGEPYAPPPGEGAYGQAPPPDEGRHYNQGEIIEAGHGFFGAISQNLASAVEYAFKSQGRPNGYILGEDAGGAFVVGLRYGEGRLFTKEAGDHKVFWQGPSLGYDAGAEGSKAMVLVYNLRDPSEIYNRFGGVQGAAYVVGGLSVQFQKYEDVTLAIIRSGVGLRLGANVGYLKYTRAPTWNPL